jgi:hypothetical protein
MSHNYQSPQHALDDLIAHGWQEEPAAITLYATFPDWASCKGPADCDCSFCHYRTQPTHQPPQPEAEYLRDQLAWIASLPEWKRVFLATFEADIMAELDRLEE